MSVLRGCAAFYAGGTLPEVAGRVDGAETMHFFWEAQLQFPAVSMQLA